MRPSEWHPLTEYGIEDLTQGSTIENHQVSPSWFVFKISPQIIQEARSPFSSSYAWFLISPIPPCTGPTRVFLIGRGGKERFFKSVPSSALLDFGDIQLQQVVEPCQQFLSKRREKDLTVSKSIQWSLLVMFSWISSHLDSPMVVVVG